MKIISNRITNFTITNSTNDRWFRAEFIYKKKPFIISLTQVTITKQIYVKVYDSHYANRRRWFMESDIPIMDNLKKIISFCEANLCHEDQTLL